MQCCCILCVPQLIRAQNIVAMDWFTTYRRSDFLFMKAAFFTHETRRVPTILLQFPLPVSTTQLYFSPLARDFHCPLNKSGVWLERERMTCLVGCYVQRGSLSMALCSLIGPPSPNARGSKEEMTQHWLLRFEFHIQAWEHNPCIRTSIRPITTTFIPVNWNHLKKFHIVCSIPPPSSFFPKALFSKHHCWEIIIPNSHMAHQSCFLLGEDGGSALTK